MGTFLGAIQDAVTESAVTDRPTVALANTNAIIVQMVALLNKAGKHLAGLYPYTELNREYTFDLVASQAAYPLPSDFDHELYETHWNRSEYWLIRGPMSAQEWQYLKSGLGTTSPYQRYRIKGIGINQLYIDPTPASGDAGKTCALEYQSKNWLRPRTWANATVYAAGAYCFYDGVYYQTTSGGTSSGTKPTDDVGVSDWAVYSGLYETAVRDDDVIILDYDTAVQGLKAYYKKAHTFEGWEDDMGAFELAAREAYAKTAPGRVVRLSRGGGGRWPNIAQTGYGNYEG